MMRDGNRGTSRDNAASRRTCARTSLCPTISLHAPIAGGSPSCSHERWTNRNAPASQTAWGALGAPALHILCRRCLPPPWQPIYTVAAGIDARHPQWPGSTVGALYEPFNATESG